MTRYGLHNKLAKRTHWHSDSMVWSKIVPTPKFLKNSMGFVVHEKEKFEDGVFAFINDIKKCEIIWSFNELFPFHKDEEILRINKWRHPQRRLAYSCRRRSLIKHEDGTYILVDCKADIRRPTGMDTEWVFTYGIQEEDIETLQSREAEVLHTFKKRVI